MAERTYVVSGYLTISVTKVIRARSKAEAKRKADELAAPSLCYRCSSAGAESEDEWELNGFDDPPEDCVRYVEPESNG